MKKTIALCASCFLLVAGCGVFAQAQGAVGAQGKAHRIIQSSTPEAQAKKLEKKYEWLTLPDKKLSKEQLSVKNTIVDIIYTRVRVDNEQLILDLKQSESRALGLSDDLYELMQIGVAEFNNHYKKAKKGTVDKVFSKAKKDFKARRQ